MKILRPLTAAAALSTMLAFAAPIGAYAGQQVPEQSVAASTQIVDSADLAEALGLEGTTLTEGKAALEAQGFSADAQGVYSKQLGSGITIGVATPTEMTPQDIAIKWDPLPYLIGTGADWANLAKSGAVAIAAAVCAPAGIVAGLCAAVAQMIMNGFGNPNSLPNAKDCYVMKNFNLPPEQVSRSQCAGL